MLVVGVVVFGRLLGSVNASWKFGEEGFCYHERRHLGGYIPDYALFAKYEKIPVVSDRFLYLLKCS
jgi:hypothetical protein